MTSFITAIQFHDANETDYAIFFEALEKLSFIGKRRVINIQPAGKKPGEFNLDGNISLPQAVDLVQKSAVKTGRQYSFTIMKNKLAA
ncbi:MAG: hypothetical protein QM791_07630 [Ferruginibacter sp.]